MGNVTDWARGAAQPGGTESPSSRIAFVFSGQGDQHPGMGRELAAQYESAAAVYALCDQIRPGTSAQCFEGSEEELKETKNTQPCLLATELAMAAVLTEAGIRPSAVAGFSLGEVAACTFAGMMDLETGFRAVCRRGALMQQAAEQVDAAMAAVVKLSPEKVTELCSRYEHVYPVNFNCPGNITVSGLSAELTAFAADVKAAGGRALPLKVKGGFHSPFMAEAAKAFGAELAGFSMSEPQLPVYANKTAQPYGAEAAATLAQQICSPVRWEDTIRNMIAAGIDTFVEIGPGKTLINMIKKIDADIHTYAVTDLPQLLAELA